MHDARSTQAPQRRRFAATWVALTLCLALAAGCGGDDDDAAPDAGPLVTEFKGDPNMACQVVTKAEVEAAIATKVRDGLGDAGTICTYMLENAFDQSVVLERTNSPQSAQIFELNKTSSAAVEPLTGVGNDAFLTGNKAYVLKGTAMAAITVSVKQPPAATTAALRKLAQAAALHL